MLPRIQPTFFHSPSPGRSPPWGHRLWHSCKGPLDGAVAGLKAKRAFPPAHFALLHEALFSMSWHASLWPSWPVLLPRSGFLGIPGRAESPAPRGALAASCRVAIIVANDLLSVPDLGARHPMLSASFDACLEGPEEATPSLRRLAWAGPENATGRLHQHQGLRCPPPESGQSAPTKDAYAFFRAPPPRYHPGVEEAPERHEELDALRPPSPSVASACRRCRTR